MKSSDKNQGGRVRGDPLVESSPSTIERPPSNQTTFASQVIILASRERETLVARVECGILSNVNSS